MSDALPLPPRPDLEQYKKLAKDLQDACKSSDPDAIREWAAGWLESLARLYGPFNWPLARGREPEAEQIERRWNKLKETTEHLPQCKLAGAQFFIAREHGFTSWPKFARHVQELARANSPVSAFESAADAIVNGDLPALRRLLAGHPGLARERSARDWSFYISSSGGSLNQGLVGYLEGEWSE